MGLPLLTDIADKEGYVMVGHDHEGHGRSEGTRGLVNDFDHLAQVRRHARDTCIGLLVRGEQKLPRPN